MVFDIYNIRYIHIRTQLVYLMKLLGTHNIWTAVLRPK